NIKLEAYTRRENIKIFNVKEESVENTEELIRKLFVTKLQIPNKDVKNIRFERVHRIPSRAPDRRSSRPRPVIARFSFYQDKEFVRSFYENLKGTVIGIANDFPREIEEIHKTLYSVSKKAHFVWRRNISLLDTLKERFVKLQNDHRYQTLN
ncbi:unnamed protein product, partial [Pocillopora meandrina]